MMNHESELRPLIEQYAILSEVESYFLKRYGYSPKAVHTILDDIGITFPTQWAMNYKIPRR